MLSVCSGFSGVLEVKKIVVVERKRGSQQGNVQQFGGIATCGQRGQNLTFSSLPHIMIHLHNDINLPLHIHNLIPLFDPIPPALGRALTLLLLNVLAALAQPVPVHPQPVRQTLALEVRQDARDDGVGGAEDGDGDVAGAARAESGERGGDDDLPEVAGVDHRGGEVELEARGALFGDDAGVDAEVGGGAGEWVFDGGGGGAGGG